MPWSTRTRPNRTRTDAKYRTKEHRDAAAAHRRQLEADGSGTCAEIVCVKRTRLLLPGMDVHLCHDRRTGAVLGLGHAACNRSEAARYARAIQDASRLRW